MGSSFNGALHVGFNWYHSFLSITRLFGRLWLLASQVHGPPNDMVRSKAFLQWVRGKALGDWFVCWEQSNTWGNKKERLSPAEKAFLVGSDGQKAGGRVGAGVNTEAATIHELGQGTAWWQWLVPAKRWRLRLHQGEHKVERLELLGKTSFVLDTQCPLWKK